MEKIKTIKTFEFQVSCANGSPTTGIIAWKDTPTASTNMKQCASPEDIDKKINKFLEDVEYEGKKLVDIKDSTYTLKRHNNAGCDTIIRKITLVVG